MNDYKTIYTITNEPSVSISLILTLVMLSTFIYLFYRFEEFSFGKKIYKYFMITFSISLMIIFIDIEYFEKKELQNIYKNMQYKIVKGVIKNYKAQIPKKREESFEVAGVKFNYSNDTLGAGFKKNGLFYDGLEVKVYYVNDFDKNIILRIDIKVKDKI